MAIPYLLDAVSDDDEVTEKRAPAPELLLEARAMNPHQRSHESVSGVALVSRPPPPPSQRRTLPLDSLRRLRDLFADHIGPAARPLLLQAIAALGADPAQFPLPLANQLLNDLSRCFDDPKKSRAFYEEASNLLRKE